MTTALLGLLQTSRLDDIRRQLEEGVQPVTHEQLDRLTLLQHLDLVHVGRVHAAEAVQLQEECDARIAEYLEPTKQPSTGQ